MDKRPLVGIAVIVIKEDRVLLGKRKNAHGSGTRAFPGGHLEFKESSEDGARREVLITNLLKLNFKLARFAHNWNDGTME